MDSKLFTLHTIETPWNKIKDKFYIKSADGIPKSDLDTTVQSSLDKADSALQEHQDISGKQDKSTAVTHRANTVVGSTTKPVYVTENGVAMAIDHSINADVPANAKFTDTTYSDATQSTHGLMSAADKVALDSMSTIHINFNTGSNVVGVKFKVNRVSANFIIMENNGRRANLSISYRNNLDAKATAYVSSCTNSKFKVYVDNNEYIYVLFVCADWSYITCTSTVHIENMEIWRGASYPTDLKIVEIDARILLDNKNFSSYALAKDGIAEKAKTLTDSGWTSPEPMCIYNLSVIKYRKYGKCVTITGFITLAKDYTDAKIFQLPEDCRPSQNIFTLGSTVHSPYDYFPAKISNDGYLTFLGKTENFFKKMTSYAIQVTFFVD